MGRIVTVVCVVVLVFAGYWWWRNTHGPNPFDGSVTSRDAPAELGTIAAENSQNTSEAHPTPSRSDTPGTINTEPVRADSSDLKDQGTPLEQESYRHDARDIPPLPPGDTQPSENLEGFRFAGSGVFQWYRQGDITYRLNTRTGESCIIYATMEEWHRPEVYRHGCRAH